MHFTAVFRSFGDPVFQVKGMIISTAFNAVLDPIMIHFMKISGAAWATVFSEVLCFGFAIVYYKRKKMFRLNLHNASLNYVKPLLKVEIPSAIQQCIPAISSATMLLLFTKFGVTTIAAYGVTNKLEITLFYPAMAMNMAITTIVGQCKGAGRVDRVKDYMKCGLLFGGIFLAVVSVLINLNLKGEKMS